MAGARVDIGAYELDLAQMFGDVVDADADGMRDAWEQFYGLNWNDATDANLDADGDRFTNMNEDGAGTNPQDSLSLLRLSLQTPSATNVSLSWMSVTNRFYDLQASTNLTANWNNLATNISGTGANQTMAFPRSPVSSSFYRIRVYR